MSVPVDLDDLGAQLEQFGTAPFLITTGADQRPHTTHVVVTLDAGTLACSVGRTTAKNADERPAVCLLWPPFERGGYSLILDGHADSTAGGSPAGGSTAGESPSVRVTPTRAVLHRNALGDGYEADCSRIDGTKH
jgi:hypothetical protein